MADDHARSRRRLRTTDPYFAPLDCLVDLIQGKGENLGPASVGVAAVELIEAAYRSAASGGAPVEIGS